MKTKNILTAGLVAAPLMAVVFTPAVSNAQVGVAATGDMTIQAMPVNVGVGANMDVKAHMNDTMPNNQANDGRMYKGGKPGAAMMASSTMRHWGYVGVVTAINGSSSFTITTRDRDTGATTTRTVAVSAQTAFHSKTTDNETIANLVVGQRVLIAGDFATSTNTISATRVDIMAKAQADASSTDDHDNGLHRGIFQRIISWFKKIF